MSNIDIYISIVLVHGSLDIYVSPLSTAVKLVAGAGGTNHISISNKYQVIFSHMSSDAVGNPAVNSGCPKFKVFPI